LMVFFSFFISLLFTHAPSHLKRLGGTREENRSFRGSRRCDWASWQPLLRCTGAQGTQSAYQEEAGSRTMCIDKGKVGRWPSGQVLSTTTPGGTGQVNCGSFGATGHLLRRAVRYQVGKQVLNGQLR
jgi:hypothetical protein